MRTFFALTLAVALSGGCGRPEKPEVVIPDTIPELTDANPGPRDEQLTDTASIVKWSIREYGGYLTTVEDGIHQEVAVPERLEKAFAAEPDAVIQELLRVASEGKPFESASACAFAVGLLSGPAYGNVFILSFSSFKTDYDEVHKAYGMSPRRHWIGIVQAEYEAYKERKGNPRPKGNRPALGFQFDALKPVAGKKE